MPVEAKRYIEVSIGWGTKQEERIVEVPRTVTDLKSFGDTEALNLLNEYVYFGYEIDEDYPYMEGYSEDWDKFLEDAGYDEKWQIEESVTLLGHLQELSKLMTHIVETDELPTDGITVHEMNAGDIVTLLEFKHLEGGSDIDHVLVSFRDEVKSVEFTCFFEYNELCPFIKIPL